MPPYPKLSRSGALPHDSIAITSLPVCLFDFLTPAIHSRHRQKHRNGHGHDIRKYHAAAYQRDAGISEAVFISSLNRAATCRAHRPHRSRQRNSPLSSTFFSTKSTELSSNPQNRTPTPETRVWKPKKPARVETKSEYTQPDAGGTANGVSLPIGSFQRRTGFFDSHAQRFAAGSSLPEDFFKDLDQLQSKIHKTQSLDVGGHSDAQPSTQDANPASAGTLKEQMNLLQSVRSLESRLEKAKADLRTSMTQKRVTLPETRQPGSNTVVLTKNDYLGLVDLYYYTLKNRFTPDAPDLSPTPLFLEDYSFKLSEDFSSPQAMARDEDDEKEMSEESPLKQIEQMLRSRQLREISTMQLFIGLLLDESSSNRALFEAYKKFPQPGVTFLPLGIIRVFLQRMATPWTKSEKSMLRYLSLIDDMQKAGLRITRAEWSSAIYLAGRSFARVTEGDINSAFRLWRRMEDDAGIQGSHVTFNILFDIAVRAGKFVLADTVLKEMHDRGLRLNRLGRVNLIYYHGLRGDGDGVRKTYRDFVEAGEIVDTLVLNCVIASLLNAQEPSAAEQIYERMKNLQSRLRKGQPRDTEEVLYTRYPPPGSAQIDHEMASNVLGRVLQRSFHLKDILPQHHAELQQQMPLTPDHTTFRSMISYHANVSGNLDRLTVLLNEMTELFGLPFTSLNFQLLFKGFALHGAASNRDSAWSVQRLDLVWDACRNAIKDVQAGRRSRAKLDSPKATLPTIKEIENPDQGESSPEGSVVPSQQPAKLKRLTNWNNFVLDLAAYPRERRKPIERVHAQLFDDEPDETRKPGFSNPFSQTALQAESRIQQTYYPGGDLALDHEEGEYTLPSPGTATNPTEATALLDAKQDPDTSSQTGDEERYAPHEVHATRPLICWLLRAYTRCTGSRARVEEVWNSARKIWRPLDSMEKEVVIKVLRRCLRDCDRFGPPRGL